MHECIRTYICTHIDILSPLRLAAAINMFVAVIGLDFLFLRLSLLLILERSSTSFCTNDQFFLFSLVTSALCLINMQYQYARA